MSDIIRSIINKRNLTLRNPKSTRPWQHVLEPLSGYLTLGSLLIRKKLISSVKPNWNFGPNESNCKTVLEIVKKTISLWGDKKKINVIRNKKFKESRLLMLSSRKAKKELNWKPTLNFEETIGMTVQWYKLFFKGGSVERLSRQQIDYFLSKKKKV